MKSKAFSEMLEDALSRYRNRAVTTLIDWNLRESVRARMRTLVRRLLRKYKYPPDLQEKATETVLKQAEMLAGEWAG